MYCVYLFVSALPYIRAVFHLFHQGARRTNDNKHNPLISQSTKKTSKNGEGLGGWGYDEFG